MAVEKLRGCGYRKVGGLYLVGTGIARACDMLPFELAPCPTCGFQIPFNRGFMWISKKWIEHFAEQHCMQTRVMEGDTLVYKCQCPQNCPLCFPTTSNDLERYGFMWAGSKYYTPASFVKEAREMGVCKRIAEIPKGLELGKTWVLLAHPKVPFSPNFSESGLRKNEPKYKPAVFYAFRPQKVEKLIWQSKATKRALNKLKKQGITPIVIPDGDKDHAPKAKKR